MEDIKKAVGYTGNIAWFDNAANAKRCQDLFQQHREWRLATVTPKPDAKVKQATDADKDVLEFKLEENWVDGGWCIIGHGPHKRQVRLLLDLGAQRSFGSRSLFYDMAKDIRAARQAWSSPDSLRNKRAVRRSFQRRKIQNG